MESLLDLLEEDRQKKLLYSALKDLIPGMNNGEYSDLIELMLEKIGQLHGISTELEKNRSDELKQAAIDMGVSEDTVIGGFVYFMVILENVLLKEEVSMLKSVLGNIQ